MRLIITGGAGFIGTNLIKLLLKKKIKVLNYDALKYASNLQSRGNKINDINYKFVKGDICNHGKFLNLLKKYKPNGVINLAAESHVDRSIDNPAPFLKTNIFGTYTLLKSSYTYWQKLKFKEKKLFKFLHISTDEVYGDLPFNVKSATELNPFLPSSPYAASKASSDHLVMAWNKTFDFPAMITNCSNNYGPFQHPEKFIPHIIISALCGKKIPIYGNGKQIRDWIHVEDHVYGILKVFSKGKIGETYNIGGSNQKKNLEIALMVCRYLDKFFKKVNKSYINNIEFVHDRPGHDKRYAINANKLKKLGWKPKISFKTGMEQTINWYLKNDYWWKNILKKNYNLKRLGKLKI